MKWTRNILILLTLVAFAADELSAQTTSSAAQVVTFGVQRVARQASRSSNVVNTMSRTPLKVTVGSESRFQEAAEFSASTSVKASSGTIIAHGAIVSLLRPVSAPNESNIANSKSASAKADPPFKPILTITE